MVNWVIKDKITVKKPTSNSEIIISNAPNSINGLNHQTSRGRYEYTIKGSSVLKLNFKTDGLNPGQVWKLKNTDIGYLSIAKNMSTSFINFLKQHNLIKHGYVRYYEDRSVNSISKKLAFLRDPRERYISGLTEYIGLTFGKRLRNMSDSELTCVAESLIDIPMIDEHTLEQIHFFNNLSLKKFTIAMMDSTVEQKVINWLSENGVKFSKNESLKIPKKNVTNINAHKKRVYDIVTATCNHNNSVIKARCKCDYELIKYFESRGQIL